MGVFMSEMRKVVRSNAAVFILLLLSLSACTSSKPLPTASPAEHYQHAMKLFEKRDYDGAARELEPLMFTTRATALEDDVLFYLGQSYYNTHQYLLAADMFKRLIQQTPESTFAKTTQFQLAKSYQQLSPEYELDQEFTVKAINEFRLYLDLYPGKDNAQVSADIEMYKELLKLNPNNESYKAKYAAAQAEFAGDDAIRYSTGAIVKLREKLARNRFSIAKNYVELKKYHAASIYFDQVLKFYSDTSFYEQAWLGKIDVAVKRKKWYEARQAIEEYQQRFPNHKNKVEGLYKKVLDNFKKS
jgi:outer membrane protein assembly factor BamD